MIRFAGFAQREQLAIYYALAEMLILPTYTDTWGLVVNEAMACGLPVIVSRAAGCAADLVTENWNGLLVPAEGCVVADIGHADSCQSTGPLRDDGREQRATHIPITRRRNGPEGLRGWSKQRGATRD